VKTIAIETSEEVKKLTKEKNTMNDEIDVLNEKLFEIEKKSKMAEDKMDTFKSYKDFVDMMAEFSGANKQKK
jgi:predicted  nucleic acid-binding Zn-ribbon protein